MKVFVAIIALTVLETVALVMHMDGIMFTPIIVAIAGLGGYSLKDIIKPATPTTPTPPATPFDINGKAP